MLNIDPKGTAPARRKECESRLARALALVACGLATAALGQGNTVGYIVGEVASRTGPLPGVSVAARNVDTAFDRTAVTGRDGRYRFSALPVGRYEVTVAVDGTASKPILAEVNVGEGTVVDIRFEDPDAIEEVVVIGEAVTPVDVRQSETTTLVTAVDIGRLPIPRDANAVALMAPGAVYGDTAFGAVKTRQHYGTGFGLASLGGASVAENAYYVNGMNVTNFRNGLGGSTVPFEFYDQFQIKTSGYSAEFGRSTGGVVNAVTKSGSNELGFVVGANYAPDALRGKAPNVPDPANPGEYDSVYEFDRLDELEGFLSMRGPLVRDRLFAYAIYNLRDIAEDNYTGGSELLRDVDDGGFWGLKLDWLIAYGHRLEYTGFSDERATTRTTFEWREADNAIGRNVGQTFIENGGANHIVKYAGFFGEGLTVSALWGASAYDLTRRSSTGATCPAAYDSRGGGLTRLGCWTNFTPSTGNDERRVARLDFEGMFGHHLLRFGMDREENTSVSTRTYSGGEYFRYYPATPGDVLNNGAVVPEGVTELARYRIFVGGGEFDVITTAFYVEDEWTVTDALTLRLGIRNERFDNRNAQGATFIEITDQYAPRLGLAWDVGGEGTAKVFANYGRYHLPVASNTNIRLAGAELFTQDWHVLDAPVAEDGSTVLGAKLGATTVYGDGTVHDVRTVIDLDIEPMYQDEIIVGYERQISDRYIASVSYAFRDLRRGIEDLTIDEAIGAPGTFHYVLANPGRGVRTFYDLDGDGTLDELHLSAEDIGMPAVKRRYHAVNLGLERRWDGVFYVKGLYTWSHSYGNYEGMVRSDNGQDDAGITTQYDFAGLVEGADGNLPNDRRHQLKLWGAWAFTASWQASASFQYTSGRPRNAFGVHPTDPYAALYGASSFYNQGRFVPRGTLETTSDTFRLDLGLKFAAALGRGALTARLDIFNAFDWDAETEVDEHADTGSGQASPTFGLPTRFQQPRTTRLGLQYEL